MGDHQEQDFANPDFQDSDGLDPINRLAFIHCTTCGASTKRRSPSSSSPLPNPTTTSAAGANTSEPKPKKTMVEEDLLLRGFTKISLPFTSPNVPTIPPSTITQNKWVTSSYPILRRCSSDPFTSPDSIPGSGSSSLCQLQSPDKTAKISVNPSTPSPVKGNNYNNSSALPPLPPPTLRRSVSDVISAAYQTPVTVSQGVQVPVDSVIDESPNSKRLRRMKDRMREMSQWWDELIREGEDGGSDDNDCNTTKDDGTGTDSEEEAVSVEKKGECVIIHFKCPCGKGYKILLSGKTCYYKLV